MPLIATGTECLLGIGIVVAAYLGAFFGMWIESKETRYAEDRAMKYAATCDKLRNKLAAVKRAMESELD